MDEDNIAEHEFMDDLQINDEDKEAFERFQNPIDEKRTRTLADIIMERIQDKQTDIQSKLSDADSLKLEEIDPKYFFFKSIAILRFSYNISSFNFILIGLRRCMMVSVRL